MNRYSSLAALPQIRGDRTRGAAPDMHITPLQSKARIASRQNMTGKSSTSSWRENFKDTPQPSLAQPQAKLCSRSEKNLVQKPTFIPPAKKVSEQQMQRQIRKIVDKQLQDITDFAFESSEEWNDELV